jgi:hypothetical protein
VAIFSRKRTIATAELVHVGVRLGVTVEHRLVETPISALVALVRFRSYVTAAQMILQMMFEIGHESATGAFQHLLRRYMLPHV